MRVRKGALRIMAGVGALEAPDKVKDVFGGSVLAPGTFFGAFDLVLGDVDVRQERRCRSPRRRCQSPSRASRSRRSPP
jgi:hypothetical protein